MGRDEHDITPLWKGVPDLGRFGEGLFNWGLESNWPRFFRSGPTIDMYETDKDVIVEAEVPGYSPDHISVRVTSNGLIIRGQMEKTEVDRQNDYHMRERRYGSFSRTIRFPTEAMPDRATAKYKDGVLRITAPKAGQATDNHRELRIEREQ